MSLSAPDRVPLGPLPLSRFVPPANNIPSPISLPTKRNAPSASSSLDAVKTRKVSRADEGGLETLRKSRMKEVTPKAKEVTPKVKAVLERDDLGVGRSPARRLFVGSAEAIKSLGISGAIATSSSIPVQARRATVSMPSMDALLNPHEASDNDTRSHPLPLTAPGNIPLHDPGFTIHADPTSTVPPPPFSVGIGTPKSKRTTTRTTTHATDLALDAIAHIPSSASSSRTNGTLYDDDQENVPPSRTASQVSVRSSPSRSGGSMWKGDEDVYLSSGGSGRRRLRTTERSKLGLGSVLRGEVDVNGAGDDDENELTPGRREAVMKEKERGKGKASMAQEVDRI
ncbi:MAG: hypothetical protein TREMPRED_001483 [Tremellales sp. Tagirdzhanova-0007]|nr:MAG: hypothetical protein TREMPRED_001483 [Tremellales sp. Tagirdzhanova-0007]